MPVDDHLDDHKKLCHALAKIITDFLNRQLPLRRIVFVASILKNCSVKIPDYAKLSNRLLKEQKNDGGWIDCEDTAWAIYFLAEQKSFERNVNNGILWLEAERCANKGWGFCKRDHSCIPITAQILFLLPYFSRIHEAGRWLEDEWNKDIHSSVNLNYKAAWYLLAFKRLHFKLGLSRELFIETIHYLCHEQRDDGSWGPWKNHPAAGDYFITGICMASLALSYEILTDIMIIKSLKKAVQWIKNTQLENGLFPTHYIEEGSSWIFFGWTKALDLLRKNNNL